MRKKYDFYKIIKLIFITLIFFSILFFFSQLNFILKEDSKTLGKENLFLFLLTKIFLAKEIFEKEPEVIKVNFKINFKKLEINIEKIKDEPIAIICFKDCFYLSRYSYIYKPKNGNLLENKMKIFSANPIYENSYLLPEITSALAKVFEYSNLKLVPLKEVYIMSNFDLKIKTQNFYFLIDPFKDVNHQLKKLAYFLSNYKKTTYTQIDLRIPQKIFFK